MLLLMLMETCMMIMYDQKAMLGRAWIKLLCLGLDVSCQSGEDAE